MKPFRFKLLKSNTNAAPQPLADLPGIDHMFGGTLETWASSSVVFAHALAVVCRKLPEASALVEESAQQLQGKVSVLSRDARAQSEAAERVLASSKRLAAGGGEMLSTTDFTELFGHTLQTMIASMGNTARDVKKSAAMLDAATRVLAKAEALLTELQGINRQAGMLAFNANIEAQRAGEAGKAFAVVADEVRNVSRRINDLAQNAGGHIGEANTRIGECGNLLKTHSETDVSGNVSAQKKLEKLLGSLVNQNDEFRGALGDSAMAADNFSNNASTIAAGFTFTEQNREYTKSSLAVLADMAAYLQSMPLRVEPAQEAVQETTAKLAAHFQQGHFRQEFIRMLAANGLLGEDVIVSLPETAVEEPCSEEA